MDLIASAVATIVLASMSGISNLTSNPPIGTKNPTPELTQESTVESNEKQKETKLNQIFVVPVDGCEYFETGEYASSHPGVDFAQKNGECTVVAAADGKVTFADWSDDGAGYKVVVKHSDGYVSEYHHGNGEFFVKKGDKVSQGSKLMTMGCTGLCTGTHVHFEVLKDGVNVDPKKLK